MELTPEERRQIYEEEKLRLRSETRAAINVKAYTRPIGVLAIATVVLAAACWVGYRQYRQSQFKAALEQAIGRDLGLTETVLKTESDSDNITFGEMFELCNKSVEGRTNLCSASRRPPSVP